MNVWYHLSTIFKQRRALRIAGLLSLCVALTTTYLFSVVSHAAPGINQTLSFQGRLLSAGGAVVPDGHYNIQFKIYQDGAGTAANNPGGTLKWTETYINNGGTNGVDVINGYFSVNLGSLNAFGTQVDWNQDTLWLSMNIAGSSSSCTTFGSSPCTADGEMLSMKRITSTPYALNSGQLDGKAADQFTQLGQGTQTDSSNNSSIAINKTGSGNLIQMQHAATDVLTVANNGDIVLGNNSDHSISVSNAVSGVAGSQLLLAAGGGGSGSGSSGGNLVLQGGAGGGTNANGGNITLSGGGGSGSGVSGLVIMGTPTFSTVVDDTNCFTSGALVASNCTVSTPSVDGSSAILVGFSTTGKTATVPDPTITTAGRVVYVMAANGSEDFTLSMNGGGAGNKIIMKQNTATTLMWNGTDWVVAGTSGANTLQGNSDADGTVNNVQIGDNSDSTTTLLTLDSATTAPTITNGEALVGSMYFDTTLGALQCYEADGWGACSAAPDTFVTISPEYTNAVMNGTDIGTISSDLCSDTLNINDGSSGQPTICGTNETYNFYKWTTDQTSNQTRSIYVTYQLPSNFKSFVAGSLSLMGRTDSADSSVNYQVYKDHPGSALASCGSAVAASTGSQSTWQKATASGGADPSACSFAAGDSLLIRINLTAKDNANAYISNLGFIFSNN